MHKTSDRRGGNRSPIDLLLNRFVDGQPYLCRATDISRTGIRLQPILEPASGSKVRYMGLQFQLPGSERVITASAEAVFVGKEGHQVGVRFTRIAPEHADALDRYLASF